MAQIEYVAGVCNIGPQEIARRRTLGWASLAVAGVLVAVLVWTGVNPLWRLFVFFPVMLSASGFLQAHFRFCSGFARQGIFNFGPIGSSGKVADDASTSKDKKRGTQITLYAVVVGVVVAIVALLL